jgi:kynurenine 3-monooxygenase
MNCGFEDCRILDDLLEKHDEDWRNILEQFQVTRKRDTDAIADLAVNNFIEMRDRTADPKFLLQKKIEARLHDKFPDKWIPAYSQVTFSPHIPYSQALERGRMQESVMQEVMKEENIEVRWNDDDFLLQVISKIDGQWR